MEFVYALVSSIIVSLVSVIMAVPLLVKKKLPHKVLLFLLSISVGAILSVVFMDFLPELFSHTYTVGTALTILGGFVVMFAIESFVHFKHDQACDDAHHAHSHAYALAPINVIGDGIHNFVDGLVIAGSYAVDISLGIAATISIALHEAPIEIADLGILLYSGLSRKKALFFNFLSAITAIIGVLVGFYLIKNLGGFSSFIIPFATGNFLYIAASNLVPQLHRKCTFKDTILHIFAISIGIAIIVLITLYGPGHVHG